MSMDTRGMTKLILITLLCLHVNAKAVRAEQQACKPEDFYMSSYDTRGWKITLPISDESIKLPLVLYYYIDTIGITTQYTSNHLNKRAIYYLGYFIIDANWTATFIPKQPIDILGQLTFGLDDIVTRYNSKIPRISSSEKKKFLESSFFRGEFGHNEFYILGKPGEQL